MKPSSSFVAGRTVVEVKVCVPDLAVVAAIAGVLRLEIDDTHLGHGLARYFLFLNSVGLAMKRCSVALVDRTAPDPPIQ
jgi:hypothetical protein